MAVNAVGGASPTAVVGAGSSALSSAGSALTSAANAYFAYHLGELSDKTAFDRQQWMMANAHQLEVSDLKAAGLNPILSGMGGSGASASGVSNTAGSAGASGLASGTNAARLILTEIDKNREQANLNAAQAREVITRTDREYGTGKSVQLYGPDGEPMGSPIVDNGLRGQEAAANVRLMEERARNAGYENIISAARAGVYKDYPVTPEVEKFLDLLERSSGAARNLGSLFR